MSDIKLTMSMSPHIRKKQNTQWIMWAVSGALLPALAMSVVVFGPNSLILVGISVITAVITEYFGDRLLNRGRPFPGLSFSSIKDGSAVLTGLLLAFNVPAGVPWWQIVIGSFFAIMVGKMVFGGLGQNPFNPALAGRAFMMASFPTTMTTFPTPFAWLQTMTDGTTAATSLGAAKEGLARGFTLDVLREQGLLLSHSDLFFGLTGGAIGEVSALAIVIGGIVLIGLKIVSIETPLAYLGGLGLITGIMWLINPQHYLDPLYHIISGGAMLAGFFMISDMVTSPMTKVGRFVYSLVAGILTGVIRLFGGYPEGSSYAILIMNALVPVFDHAFPPKKFGTTPTKSTGVSP